jgi:predicted nuclease of predicted toxin-antitoxin system
MKLLLDENLSRRVVPFLQNDFPGSSQVALIGLERVSDRTIWDYARANNFSIVTRDTDFGELSALLGAPPQVVWIRTPNLSKSSLLKLLLGSKEAIIDALQTRGARCIELDC